MVKEKKKHVGIGNNVSNRLNIWSFFLSRLNITKQEIFIGYIVVLHFITFMNKQYTWNVHLKICFNICCWYIVDNNTITYVYIHLESLKCYKNNIINGHFKNQ